MYKRFTPIQVRLLLLGTSQRSVNMAHLLRTIFFLQTVTERFGLVQNLGGSGLNDEKMWEKVLMSEIGHVLNLNIKL